MKNKKKSRQFLAGHQRSWIWGRHAVLEILEAGKWPVQELYLAQELSGAEYAAAENKAHGLGVMPVPASYQRLRDLCGVHEHQGYLARMGSFPYAELQEILAAAPACPLYLILNAARDPHNFGAMIRSAAALGAHAVIVGETGQTPVNSQVARSSAGSVNRVPIVKVQEIERAAETLKEKGIVLLAADQNAPTPVWSCNFRRPVALVLGNEAEGIAESLLGLCDERICIPRIGGLDSLNVAAAAAAMVYEAYRQRNIR